MSEIADPIDPRIGIDWDGEYVWVQRTALLKVDGRQGDRLYLRRHDGTKFEASTKVMEQDYFFIEDERFLKPKYRPQKSFCLKADATIKLSDADAVLDAGGAVLKDDDGKFCLVPRAVYQRDYLGIAYPGTKARPPYPFPDQARIE